MYARQSSETSSHDDSFLSRTSTSSTLVESSSDISLYPADEHVMLHLDYNLPGFSELSEPPSPSSLASPSWTSLALRDSSLNLVTCSPPSVTVSKPRLWLHRRRRRTSSSDARALLTALFHSHWPRSEPEDPIFGQTAPRALSPCRARQLREEEGIKSSRPMLKPHKTTLGPDAAQRSWTDSPPEKPRVVASRKASLPPTTGLAPALSPPESCFAAALELPSSNPDSQRHLSSIPSAVPLPISPDKTRHPTVDVQLRLDVPSPKLRPHSTQSMPRSILRSNSRLERSTPCSVTFAARTGVRVYRTETASSSTLSLGSPVISDASGIPSLNWYQRRDKARGRDFDADSTVTYPPARMKKGSFFKRCFRGTGRGKDKGPPVISGPMPLASTSSLRDMRSARGDASKAEQARHKSWKEVHKTEEKYECKESCKPLLTPAAATYAEEVRARDNQRTLWGKRSGIQLALR